MTKTLILTVIYEQTILESSTVQSLLKCRAHLADATLVIWDNSASAQTVPETCHSLFGNVVYYHTPENKPLSHIYNYVISNYSDHDFLMLLDQDSQFDKAYFEELAKAAERYPDICLFLPIVKSGSTIVSPGHYFLIKGAHWSKERFGLLSSNNLVAINSGMVIRFSYLRNAFEGYDERLNFYGVDIYFMRHFAQRQRQAFVLPYTIQHDSALLSPDEPLEKRLFRFKDRLHAWKILHEDSVLRSLLIRLYIVFVAVKLSLQHKNLMFLSTGIKYALSG